MAIGVDQKLESALNNNDNNVQLNNNNDVQDPYQNQEDYDGANLAQINQMEQKLKDDGEDGFFLDIESAEYHSEESKKFVPILLILQKIRRSDCYPFSPNCKI